MLVEFQMFIDNEEYKYKVMGKQQNNKITFPDKMIPNTIIDIIFDDDMIILNRHGSTLMYQEFKINCKLSGMYKNDMGLEFTTYSFTHSMQISEHELVIDYDFYIENDKQSHNKMVIKY